MMLAGAFYFLKPKYGKKGICGCWAATRGARGDTAFFFLMETLPCIQSYSSKESTCNTGDPGSISGSRRSPEKGMATHSSILAWSLQDMDRGAQWATPWSLFLSSWGGKESDTTKQL